VTTDLVAEVGEIRELIGLARLGHDLAKIAAEPLAARIETDTRDMLAAAQARLRVVQSQIGGTS